MLVKDFITAYMAAGNKSANAESERAIQQRFKYVANEDATTGGNDILLAIEFLTDWQTIKDFANKKQTAK